MNLNTIVNMVMRRLTSQGINMAMRKGGDLMSRGAAGQPQKPIDPLEAREAEIARRERELQLEARERELRRREAELRDGQE